MNANRNGRDHVNNSGVDGKIQDDSNMTGTGLCVNKPHKSRSYLNHLVLLKWSLKDNGERVMTGFIWLRIGSNGGLL
jgi:hypothetical protein